MCIVAYAATGKRPDLQTASQQNRSFQCNHIDVFVHSHVVALLEIHIQLLAFANFGCRAVEDVQYCRQSAFYFGHFHVGVNVHHVAAQNARSQSVGGVHRRLPAPQRRFIHDVVVDEREVVEQFHRRCGMPSIGSQFAKKFVSHEAKHRPDAFAAIGKKLSTRVVKSGGLCRKRHVLGKVAVEF